MIYYGLIVFKLLEQTNFNAKKILFFFHSEGQYKTKTFPSKSDLHHTLFGSFLVFSHP